MSDSYHCFRQLRSGYDRRSEGEFPYSVMLVGVRNIQDYRVYSEIEKKEVLGGSAFNIVAEVRRIARFSRSHIKALIKQYESTSNRKFTSEAVDELFDITDGQPWCVNRICAEIAKTSTPSTITKDAIISASEVIILRHETHLDIMTTSAMRDARVQRVLEALIMNVNPLENGASLDDIEYTRDLGVIKQIGNNDNQQWRFSNKLYAEVIPRRIVASSSIAVSGIVRSDFFELENGKLKMQQLMEAFLSFSLEHFRSIPANMLPHERVYHMIFYAFLQRIVNGGGRINREYPINDDAVDVLIEIAYKDKSGKKALQKEVVELKTYRPTNTAGFKSFVKSGKDQLVEKYLTPLRQQVGYLIVWDQKTTTGEQQTSHEWIEEDYKGKKLYIIYVYHGERPEKKKS